MNVSLSEVRATTLAGIASAINSASDNPGIRRPSSRPDSGSHLVLASTSTGASNTINATHERTLSSALGYDSAVGHELHGNDPGADANFSIDGTPATSSTNTVTNAIAGVTLNLSSPSADNAAIAHRRARQHGAGEARSRLRQRVQLVREPGGRRSPASTRPRTPARRAARCSATPCSRRFAARSRRS